MKLICAYILDSKPCFYEAPTPGSVVVDCIPITLTTEVHASARELGMESLSRFFFLSIHEVTHFQ